MVPKAAIGVIRLMSTETGGVRAKHAGDHATICLVCGCEFTIRGHPTLAVRSTDSTDYVDTILNEYTPI